MFLLIFIIALVISYLLGSIPFGYIIGKISKGIDVRDYGSGKTGATNVLRTAGIGAGLLSFVLDMAKGTGAAFLSGWLISKTGTIPVNSSFYFDVSRAAGGMAAVIGHNWPIFLKFKGGRGVMPTMGAFLVLAPVAAVGATLIGFATIALWRFVSLGSMLGGLSLSIIIIYLYLVKGFSSEILVFGIISSLLIIFQHKDNISRLISGTERKLGQKAEN